MKQLYVCKYIKKNIFPVYDEGRGSSIGIATCHWLDGPGIETAPVQTGPRPTQPPMQWLPRLSRR